MNLSFSFVQVVLIVMKVYQLAPLALRGLLAIPKVQLEMLLAVLGYTL